MKVLQIHNYRKFFGGIDRVALNEQALLRSRGHAVLPFEKRTDEVFSYGLTERLLFIPNTLNHRRNLRELAALIQDTRPDIAHVHNIYPMISPAVYPLLKRLGVPSVQSFHDHRLPLLCPQGNAYRAGAVCNLCHPGRYWPCVRHKCVRSSRVLSATYALAVATTHFASRLTKCLTLGIVFNAYMRDRLIGAGFPAERIVEKPHFVAEEIGPPTYQQDNYAVFMGALSAHKGIFTLLAAMKGLPPYFRLKVLGEGEARSQVEQIIAAQALTNVDLLGFIPGPERLTLLKGARFSIVPSEFIETFGLSVLESLACGVPVLGSNLGGIPHLIQDGKNGVLFEAGNARDLSNKMEWLLGHSGETRQMGQAARATYEARYTPETNYRELMSIYDTACRMFAERRVSP